MKSVGILTLGCKVNTYESEFVTNLLKENGYDYVFFLRLYEITEDLKNDKEFLDIIKKAIEFKSQ